MKAPWTTFAALAALALAARPLGAQTPTAAPPSDSAAAPLAELTTVGSAAEDRDRAWELMGGAELPGFLMRSASSRVARGRERDFVFLRPRARTVYNSGLPFSQNEGTLWAGRGAGAVLTAGARARVGRVTLTLAPEMVAQQNSDFQTVSPAAPAFPVSRWASPFHVAGYTADVPLRFGNESSFALTAGQSSLVVDAGPAAVGVATESQWWGPGIRNALVMSTNAPGFTHAFVRTSAPLRTRVGEFEGKWVLGSLGESDYFDERTANDARSLSGVVVAWRPRWEPSLTLGATRVVYAQTKRKSWVPLHALDAFARTRERADQLFGFFGRWVFAPAGVEVYGEWARQRGLASPSHWLAEEGEPWAYTLGLQWARPTAPGGAFRLQAEASDLEKGAVERGNLPVQSYYTSDRVAQGYTHRGRAIGAAIGPGGSSQWGAADYLGARWEMGVFANRIRWENDAFYGTIRPLASSHDVSMLLGLRAGMRARRYTVRAELSSARRYNYLFQSGNGSFQRPEGVDLSNRTLRLSIEPRGR
ncbi:MAG TPA: capsule assembly Wzi family protein [Longimicrobium sp.]|nr:capsule assembly Wzi family protein [Longimicrobium sp.]